METTNEVDPGPTIFSVLSSLNSAQLKAVQHSPSTPLQILAGPGSGKTKVLTSRVAYLILHHNIPPSSICAVTFTNKAANEMRRRLTKIIGEEKTNQIRMGTFHALCALFLRKYASIVGLEPNFTVCDAEESKKLVASLLKPFKSDLAAGDITLKESMVLSMISKAKARGLSVVAMREEHKAARSAIPSTTDQINSIVSDIYESYEKILRQTNCVDFDDLLLFGVKLFRKSKKAVDWCHHVLVDEFQDTNVIQYELMHELAIRKCITVVGDPDQSIYGWRSAEIGNLSRMGKDYPGTTRILLEENYRSTGSILNASLAIVAQDKNRVQKSLFTCHPAGITPTLCSLPSEKDEAAQIANEVKRTIAYTGGLLNYGDFAILLRFTALSRTLESALQKEGVPSRILGGHKFFERLEVKDLLAYLQLIDNADYNPAFLRAVNVPSRGIGEKTLDELFARARTKNLSMLALVTKICDNRVPDIKPPIKRKLDGFVKVMQKLKKVASEGISPADLIRQLLEQIEYCDHLKKTQTDWESRWENVQELITFASEVNPDEPRLSEGEAEERSTPLRLFLQASMLSSEGDGQSEEDNKEKVTITTCHAAKGLEWPVVFIPSVEDGTFPFYRTEDVEEERRLLYVACTRAQCLLYLSHAEKRKIAGETKTRTMSPFLSAVRTENQTLFTGTMPELGSSQCRALAIMLGRPVPDQERVQHQITQYTQKYQDRVLNDVTQQGRQQTSAGPGQHCPPQIQIVTPPFTPGFTSLGQILNRNDNILVAQRYGPMTHASSTGTTKDMLPRPTAYHGSLKKIIFPPVPPTVPTPLPTHPMPSMCPQNLIQSITPKTPATPRLIGTASVTSQNEPPNPRSTSTVGVKRRLGMGQGTVGYANKKFKPPV